MKKSTEKIGFLFDLDGVIIDSESEYSKIWSKINKEFPTGVQNLETIIKGCTLSKILNDYFPESDLQEKVSGRLHELEQEMHYDYLPYAFEFLSMLHSEGMNCALVTSSDNKKMSHLKEELPDLLDFFDFIVTGDLVKSSKPSPEGYLLAASKLNKNPKNCVVFEDSLQGVCAGENSKAYVVGIAGTLPSEVLEPHADIVINNFNELDFEDLFLKLTER